MLRRPQRTSDRAALPRGLIGGYRPVLSLMRLAETTSWGQKMSATCFAARSVAFPVRHQPTTRVTP